MSTGSLVSTTVYSTGLLVSTGSLVILVRSLLLLNIVLVRWRVLLYIVILHNDTTGETGGYFKVSYFSTECVLCFRVFFVLFCFFPLISLWLLGYV